MTKRLAVKWASPPNQIWSSWLPEVSFKDRVIQLVKQIPYGSVTTYGTVATLAGKPRAARLISGIMDYNFTEHNLPWHRVINRVGFISIKCPDHTKDDQKKLLEQEGIEVSEDFIVDLKKYGWWGEDQTNLDHS